MRRLLDPWRMLAAALSLVAAVSLALPEAVAAPILADEAYASACGPISCYVAVRAFGREVSLESMIAQCGWKPGRYTDLRTMMDVIGRHRLNCHATKLDFARLAEVLRDRGCVAILPILRPGEDVKHAVTVVNVHGSQAIAIDYPELMIPIESFDLERIWDGTAILVSDGTSPARSRSQSYALAALTVVLGGSLLYLTAPRRRSPLG